ncbi:MAG: CBS domain-containing protein [Solirubrobacteraceae bacterium]
MSALSRSYHGSYRMPAFEHATVADAMHRGVMACDPEATVTEVARMMATHHVHCVAVVGVSAGDSGESLAWGVISDRELLSAGIGGDDGQTARTLACHTVLTVEPTTPLHDAAELMLTTGASHVLVISTDTQHPVGVVSTLDIAGVLAWGEA